MSTHNNKTNEKSSRSDLKSSVLDRIYREKVQPTKRWVFLCTNCMVWALWALTVIVGALALSEAMYVFMHSGIEFFEITHRHFIPFIFDSLPYVWLLAFLVMVGLAYQNIRRTRRGYRYPFVWIIISNLVLTVVLGLVLNAAGVGSMVDDMVDDMVPGYLTAEEWQEYLWAHPEDGRISGVYEGTTTGAIAVDSPVPFTDALGRRWLVSIHELSPEDLRLLRSGERVRLLGEAEEAPGTREFYACGVLPWIPAGGHSMETLSENRAAAKEIVERYTDRDSARQDIPQSASPLRCGTIIQHVFHINY